jgi:Fic family protein
LRRASATSSRGWINEDHRATIDPVVGAALAHYQFETLHPFHDGNGRIGRLMIVIQLYAAGVLGEPTLTLSPWFEARRTEYYDRLFAVSTQGEWNHWVSFFAQGLEESAVRTRQQMLDLVAVQSTFKEVVRDDRLGCGRCKDNLRQEVGQIEVWVQQESGEEGHAPGPSFSGPAHLRRRENRCR